MVKVNYSGRILADPDFVKMLLEKGEINSRAEHLNYLMYIKSSSQAYKGDNNVILDSDMKEVLKDHKGKENMIRCAFREISYPELNDITNPFVKRISCASLLASEYPFKTIYIFSNSNTQSEYDNSVHLKDMKTVQVKHGTDALEIINSYWRQYVEARQLEKVEL